MEEKGQFESPEAEIQYLERKILEKKTELKERDIKSIARDTITSHIQQTMPPPLPPSSATGAVPPNLTNTVDLLVKIVFEHGLQKGVSEARRTHNPYIIDAFHDTLADHFVNELRAKGLLAEHG